MNALTGIVSLIILFYLTKKFWSMHFSRLFLVLFSQFCFLFSLFMVRYQQKRCRCRAQSGVRCGNKRLKSEYTMKHIKFQRALFFTYVLISFLVLMIFAIFFYHYMAKHLTEKELRSLSALNASFAAQTDAVIRDIDITSANINYSSLMQSRLDEHYGVDLSYDSLTKLADLFVTINGSDIKADQINFYSLDGRLARVGMVTTTGTIDVNDLPWLEQTIALGGKKTIGLPYCTDAYSKSAKYSEWFISLYRAYSNQYGQKVGAIETVKRCKSVFKSIITYQKATKTAPASVYVFNEDGILLFPYAQTDEFQGACLIYYEQAVKSDSLSAGGGSFYNPNTQTKEYFCCERSSYTNWTYISVQEESVVLKPLHRLVSITFLAVFVLLAAAVYLSYYFSGILIRPISHLKHIIQRLELDTLGEERTDNYNTTFVELEDLYKAFQNMNDKLKVSMHDLLASEQQEFKAMNLALQSQANPHFYYNTLSSIIVLSENNQNEDVIRLCRNLTQIMRYITDSSTTVTTIGEEMEYVKKYLYCIKIRYQSSLSYTLDIEPRLLDIPIPKLLIQPLVENAIKYGTDCEPPWSLSITGKQYEDRWQIDIVDSGKGFSEDALQRISRNIAEVSENTGIPKLHINGLGIVNVYLRWKFHAKEKMIFTYGNTVDGHGICSVGQKILQENERTQPES